MGRVGLCAFVLLASDSTPTAIRTRLDCVEHEIFAFSQMHEGNYLIITYHVVQNKNRQNIAEFIPGSVTVYYSRL